MAVNGITFDEQLITSANMAHAIWVYSGKKSGITKGCQMTRSGLTVNIGAGYFLAHGRQVQLVGNTAIEIEAVTATYYSLLVFEIDLSKVNTTADFQQGYFKVLRSSSAYPTPTQQDLDDGGTVYQLPFARFMQGTGGITSWTDLTESIGTVIGEIQDELDARAEIRHATFTTGGWSNSVPYTQAVSVAGLTAGVKDVYLNTTGVTAQTGEAIQEAYNYVTFFDATAGTLTAKCYGNKPTVAFSVDIRG